MRKPAGETKRGAEDRIGGGGYMYMSGKAKKEEEEFLAKQRKKLE